MVVAVVVGPARPPGALLAAGGRVETVRAVHDVVPLAWPMTLAKILRQAVLVAGTKALAA